MGGNLVALQVVSSVFLIELSWMMICFIEAYVDRKRTGNALNGVLFFSSGEHISSLLTGTHTYFVKWSALLV